MTPEQTVPDYEFSKDMDTHLFIGKILAAHDDGRTLMEVRNKCRVGDPVEILSPGQAVRNTRIGDMRDDERKPDSNCADGYPRLSGFGLENQTQRSDP